MPSPPPARRVVYVTPLQPSHLANMSGDEQRLHRESMDRVSLCHPPTAGPTLAGAYVTPMPQVCPSSSSSSRLSATAEQDSASEVIAHSSSSGRLGNSAEESGTSQAEEQRAKKRDSAHGSSSSQATEQQSGTVESTPPQILSKHAKKKAKKHKCKKAPQSTVGNVR